MSEAILLWEEGKWQLSLKCLENESSRIVIGMMEVAEDVVVYVLVVAIEKKSLEEPWKKKVKICT